ncbi:hypothetical protein D9758_001841 [Tetrapyrgos nigripes]|uniref:Uncharacterized protein n=1 Tax=Tetrapyrgos nigripes TaxID=182062 RepID=A0A8H5GT97_9AGAR|nr:hypothetical protein D9758_001841 [Tetrapyrgos nigripes]
MDQYTTPSVVTRKHVPVDFDGSNVYQPPQQWISHTRVGSPTHEAAHSFSSPSSACLVSRFSTSSTLRLASKRKMLCESSPFDETALPTVPELEYAASLCVKSERGLAVPFGSLFRDNKTIVCFIRHFLCPLCQDYVFSISRNVSPKVLAQKGVNLVIISNGSYSMIKSYRRIFRTPFSVYTDSTHAVYNALGMTLQTTEAGPSRPEYVQHGMVSGIGMVLAHAVKARMPIWKAGGDIGQLGGEFVLGPGLQCSFAHRMRYTRSHVPILQVVKAAGIDMYNPLLQLSGPSTSSAVASVEDGAHIQLNASAGTTGISFLGVALGMSLDAEKKWMRDSPRHLASIHARRLERRGAGWIASTHVPSENTHGLASTEEGVPETLPSRTSCGSSTGACSPSVHSILAMEEEEYEDVEDLQLHSWQDDDIEVQTPTIIGHFDDTWLDNTHGEELVVQLQTPKSARSSDGCYYSEDTYTDDTYTDDSHNDGLSAKVYPFLLPDTTHFPPSPGSFTTAFESLAVIPESVSENTHTDDPSEDFDTALSDCNDLSSDTTSLSDFPTPPSKPFLDTLIDTHHLNWGNSFRLQELRRLNEMRIVDLPRLSPTL